MKIRFSKSNLDGAIQYLSELLDGGDYHLYNSELVIGGAASGMPKHVKKGDAQGIKKWLVARCVHLLNGHDLRYLNPGQIYQEAYHGVYVVLEPENPHLYVAPNAFDTVDLNVAVKLPFEGIPTIMFWQPF